MKKLQLGADPEALFVRQAGSRQSIVPASLVFGHSSLGTYIGTDGHPTPVEVRPPPSSNVLQLLATIAHAVSTLGVFAHTTRQNLALAARPIISREPLGGHIHTSFITRESDSVENKYTRVMNYTLVPLEYAVQPWALRSERNQRYGRIGDYRIQHYTTLRDGYAFWHMEYRHPSTWLQHPKLAYAYLALAKLALLNWETLAVAAYDHTVGFASADDAKITLESRLGRLLQTGKKSADLRHIPTVLRWLMEDPDPSLLNPQGLVVMEEWRKIAPALPNMPDDVGESDEDDPEVDVDLRRPPPDDEDQEPPWPEEEEAEEEAEEEEELTAEDVVAYNNDTIRAQHRSIRFTTSPDTTPSRGLTFS